MTSHDLPPTIFAQSLPEPRRPARVTVPLDDGYETYAFVYRPRGAAQRLPVLYVHGIQSHPGWFAGSSDALAAAGHAVYQVARRGSGENSQDRGDAASAGQLLADTAAACRFVLADSGREELHLLGVSWGGKLLAAFLARDGQNLPAASLTMVAPGIAPRVDVPGGTKLAIGASLLCCPARRFEIPLSDVELFTDNEAMREYLRVDPLRLHRATARFLYASRKLDGILRSAPAGAIAVPTTLILSSRDRIIDNAATAGRVRRLTADRAVIAELPGAHTLEFEADPEAFFARLVGAMEA